MIIHTEECARVPNREFDVNACTCELKISTIDQALELMIDIASAHYPGDTRDLERVKTWIRNAIAYVPLA